jgi:hypothetical protein
VLGATDVQCHRFDFLLISATVRLRSHDLMKLLLSLRTPCLAFVHIKNALTRVVRDESLREQVAPAKDYTAITMTQFHVLLPTRANGAHIKEDCQRLDERKIRSGQRRDFAINLKQIDGEKCAQLQVLVAHWHGSLIESNDFN